MNFEALAHAFAHLGVDLAPLDARTHLVRTEGGHARLTHDDGEVLFVVEGVSGSLVLREELGLVGKLAALTEVETGDDDFDDRFIVRGAPEALGPEDREALLALPPPLRFTLAEGRLRIRVPDAGDEATLAYALVRAWAFAQPSSFPAAAEGAGAPVVSPRSSARRGSSSSSPSSSPSSPSSSPPSPRFSSTIPTPLADFAKVADERWPPAQEKARVKAEAERARRRAEAQRAEAQRAEAALSDVEMLERQAPARDAVLDAVKAATSSFSGVVERTGDVVEARVDLGGDVSAVLRVREGAIELRAPTHAPPIALTPQRGLHGRLSSLSDARLGVRALDDVFIVKGQPAEWVNGAVPSLVALAKAKATVRVAGGQLVIAVADAADVAAVVAAMLTVAYRAA